MDRIPAYLNILYLFRLLAIGASFLVVSVAVTPICLIRSKDHRNNKVFCDAINFLLVKVLGLKLVVDKSAAVWDGKSVVVVANHQGVMDVIACGAVLPERSATLGKKSLNKIPLWGRIFRLGGNILVDRGSKTGRTQAMRQLNLVLKEDRASLWVFPEGTRNQSNQIKRFHDGAFRCAMTNGAAIQPVVISTYAGNVSLKRWRAGTIAVKVLPPVDFSGETEESIATAIERIKNLMQSEINELDLIAAR